MAYKVTSKGEVSYADAIETVTSINGAIKPIEVAKADGFNAMVIVHVSPSEEYYDKTLYVLPDHTLDGYDVPVGTFEYEPDPEPDPEPEPEGGERNA